MEIDLDKMTCIAPGACHAPLDGCEKCKYFRTIGSTPATKQDIQAMNERLSDIEDKLHSIWPPDDDTQRPPGA